MATVTREIKWKRRTRNRLLFFLVALLIVGVREYYLAIHVVGTALQLQSLQVSEFYAGANTVLGRAMNHTKAPTIQVFVAMTPAHGVYWERFYENSNGWHTQFPGLRSYTFDRIAKDSLLRGSNIVEIDRIEGEKSEKNNNLLLAAFEQVWNDNNQSDWYFLAEDDTIVFKDNLLRLVQTLNSSKDIFMGKCVLFNNEKMGTIRFAVGGGGILMSHTLLRKMAPNVASCRLKYANLGYGDARIGACVNYTLDRLWGDRDSCPPRGFSFTNGEYEVEVTRQPPENLIISLHQKDPVWLWRLNEAAIILGSNMTWRELGRYMNETAIS